MHRTNIYLSDEQERALAARARLEGKSRSALIREILDRELASPPAADLQEVFGQLATRYDELTQGLFDDDADLRIEV